MMQALFDTSVLVAALVKSHPLHLRAFPWYLKGRRGGLGMLVATHGLAELYASLTTYPSRPRISPRHAMLLIRESVVAVAKVISLDGQDYLDAMDAVARIGRGGGSVFDVLHVTAARKAGADTVLSFNRKHFEPIIGTHPQFIAP